MGFIFCKELRDTTVIMQSVLDLNCSLPKANEKKKERKGKKNLQAEFRDMNNIYKWFEDE